MGQVVFDGVTKRFGKVAAVNDLDLQIEDREFLVLLGPSGCGKSTALRMVAGLEQPTEGSIIIGDRVMNNVEARDRDIAMVFQSYALYPHMTVAANIEFPLKARKIDRKMRQKLLKDSAEILGLSDLLDRRPAQLSGGQRQRVALARAIVRRPQAFLMDEPLSNLDAKLRVQTRAELVELHRSLATTIVYVTHDQVEAMTMGGRIAVLDAGELQQVGPPQQVYERPANLFVARFIGNPPMNTLDGDVTAADGDLVVQMPDGTIPLPDDIEAAVRRRGLERVIVGVRPEHLSLSSDGRVGATVAVVESLGHEAHIVCDVSGPPFVIVRQPSDVPTPRVGERVRLTAPAEHLHCFDPETGERVETGADGDGTRQEVA